MIGEILSQLNLSAWQQSRRAVRVVLPFPKLRFWAWETLAWVLAIAVRVARPVVRIRFGSLISPRIGHFALNTELYLCERDAGKHGRTFDIFYCPEAVSNVQLMKMWARVLRVWPMAARVARVNRKLPGYRSHTVQLPSERDLQGYLDRVPAHLTFTQEELRLGSEGLLQLGIQEGGSFVCIHARDSAYLQAAMPGRDWSYHDYRNSDILNFLDAAKELSQRGFYVLRMGAAVEQALPPGLPKVIDYATNGRSDFLDIFLSAHCRFYLGDSDGLSTVPMVFRRPLAITNMIPFEEAFTWGASYLFIPKKLWLRQEKRFMGFREILESGVGRFLSTNQYVKRGIEPVENTSEEILALAREMDERLRGTWAVSEEDEDLQKRFWALWKPSDINKVFRARIGAEFLRQNQVLLE